MRKYKGEYSIDNYVFTDVKSGGTDQAKAAEPPTDRLKGHHQECSLYWLKYFLLVSSDKFANFERIICLS